MSETARWLEIALPGTETHIMPGLRGQSGGNNTGMTGFVLLKRIQHSFGILELVEAQEPATIVHAASNSRQGQPLPLVQATLAQKFHQCRSNAGIRKVAIIAEIIHQPIHC